ncbi:MAG: ATP-binding protein [Clostridia bacterium]|nr:ATP-binding protein [Clostridia bacterium]
MSYSRKNAILVREEFDKKRIKNEQERESRLERAYSLCPELLKIDSELSKTGLNIMASAMQGKEGLEERINALKEQNLALQANRIELLNSVGLDSDYTDMKYECDKCNDLGYVNGKMCSCYKNALIQKGYESSGIGKLFEKQSFETFSLDVYENKEEMQGLFNYLINYVKGFENDKQSLLFVGGTGLGKTHLSTAVAKSLIENGYDVVYETAQNIFFDFDNDRFRDRYSDEEMVSQKYLNCDLLIIDDLGAEAVSSFSVSCLYNIINTRLNKGLPIIASTNLSSAEIRKIYNDRITSRLFGEFTIKLFRGSDMRRR